MNPTNAERKAGPSAGPALLGPSIETRLGARVAAALTLRAEQSPHEIGERLRAAREQALARARERRAAAAAATAQVVAGQSGGAAALGAPTSWWWRAANALPVVVLVGGLVLIQQWQAYEVTLATAEIDATLLADEVPPDAYADPGFVEFLKQSER